MVDTADPGGAARVRRRRQPGTGADPRQTGRKLQRGCSVRDYVAHRKAFGLPGQTVASVSKALQIGKIHRICDDHPKGCPPGRCRRGWIDPKLADAEWASWFGERGPMPGGLVGLPEAEDRAAYQRARARREQLLVDKIQLEMDVAARSLVPNEAVHNAEFSLARKLRDELLQLPMAVARELCAIDDPIEHERRHRGHLIAVLNRLAEQFRPEPPVPSRPEPEAAVA